MKQKKKNNKRKFRKDQNYFCAYALKHKHTHTHSLGVLRNLSEIMNLLLINWLMYRKKTFIGFFNQKHLCKLSTCGIDLAVS